MFVVHDVLVRLLEVVAAVGRILAVEVEIAAALAGRLAIALDLASLAFIAAAALAPRIAACVRAACAIPGNGDVAVALRPGLWSRVLALALRIPAGVVGRAHGVARVGLVGRRCRAHGRLAEVRSDSARSVE